MYMYTPVLDTSTCRADTVQLPQHESRSLLIAESRSSHKRYTIYLCRAACMQVQNCVTIMLDLSPSLVWDGRM